MLSTTSSDSEVSAVIRRLYEYIYAFTATDNVALDIMRTMPKPTDFELSSQEINNFGSTCGVTCGA